MNINNFFTKFLFLLTLIIGVVSNATAARYQPAFTPNESAQEKVWHYIVFTASDKSKFYADQTLGQLRWNITATPDDNYKWYLIGDANDFILKSVTGKYVYTTQTGTGQETQYQITDDANLATHFNLVNGSNADTWAIHRKTGGTGNNINHRANGAICEWSVDGGCSVTFVKQTSFISYSSEPSSSAWAADTKWFTMRNNRSNINNFNYKYITTSADAIRDDLTITMRNLESNVMPADRGSYWCFTGNNTQGFHIQNAAYGPNFYLAYLGNSTDRYKMVHKDEIPGGATVLFTCGDNSNMTDGVGVAYMFRMGLSGNDNLHVNTSDFCRYWNWDLNDTGSAFMLTMVDDSEISALTAFDVYKVNLTGAAGTFSITYNDNSKTFGKRNQLVQDAYFICEQGLALNPADFTVSESGYVVSAAEKADIPNNYIKTLNLEVKDAEATEQWTVKVNAGCKVTYRGTEYDNNGTFFVRPGIAFDPTDFAVTGATNKFVWGPVFDETNHTVTFDVRSVQQNTLATGKWYQMQLVDKIADVYTGSAWKTNVQIVPEINNIRGIRSKGPYIYALGANKTSSWTMEISGATADETMTYVYVAETANPAQPAIMMQNGYYLNGSVQSTATKTALNLQWLEASKSFEWKSAQLVPWGNLIDGKPAMGVSSSHPTNSFIFHPLDEVHAYQVKINNGATATYNGDAKIINGTRTLTNDLIIFLPANVDFEKIGDQYDVSKFTLTRGEIHEIVVGVNDKGIPTLNINSDPEFEYNLVLKTEALRITPIKAQVRTTFEEIILAGTPKVLAPGGTFYVNRELQDATPFALINTTSFIADYSCHIVLNAAQSELGIYGRALPAFLHKDVVSANWFTLNLGGEYVKAAATAGANEMHSSGLNGDYRWQFIGTRYSFVMRDQNGKFLGYNIETGKMVVVNTIEEAATFRLEGSTIDHENWCLQLNDYSTPEGNPIYMSKASDGTITVDTSLGNANNSVAFNSTDAPVSSYDYRVNFASSVFKGKDVYLKMGDAYAVALLVDYNKSTAYNGGVLTVKASQASRVAANMFTAENKAQINALGYDIYDDDIVVDNTNHTITIYARFKPKFLANAAVEDLDWYSMYMVQANQFITGNEAGNNQVVNRGNETAYDFRFQFIGNENGFKVRSENGKYASWTSGGRLTWVDTYAAGETYRLVKSTAPNGKESWSIMRNNLAWNRYTANPAGVGTWSDQARDDNRIIFAPFLAKEYTIFVDPSVGEYGPIMIDPGAMPTNMREEDWVIIDAGDDAQVAMFDDVVQLASSYILWNTLPSGLGLLIDKNDETGLVTISVGQPKIVHRKNYLFDVLDKAVAMGNGPKNGFIEQGEEMTVNQFTGEEIQNTSVYDIYKFMKKGETRMVYFPTINIQTGGSTRMLGYHRYYNYGSESIDRLTDVIPSVTNRTTNREIYSNGYVFIPGISQSGMNVTLPSDLNSYVLGVDMARPTDYKRNYNGSNLLEPSISQRLVYHIEDANVIARKLHAGKFETQKIAFPTVKLGRDATHSGFDVISLQYDFENYWMYRGGNEAENNLVNITNLNQLVVEVVGNESNANVPGKIRAGNSVSTLNARYQHQIVFYYPTVDGKLVMPDNAEQTIRVYMKAAANDTYKVQIAEFQLTFMPGTELLPVNEVYGYTGEIDANGKPVRRSERSAKAMREQFGEPIASVTFDNTYVPFETENGNTVSGKKVYGLPLDFAKSNVAFGTYLDWADWAEYRITQQNEMSGGARAYYYPVEMYEQNLEGYKKTGTGWENVPDGKFLFYNDATEQPGKALSLELGGDLCAGARLYMTGWVGSNCVDNGGYHHIAMHVAVVGVSEEGTRKTVYTYNPGVVSSAYVDANGNRYTGIDYNSFTPYANNNNAWALWHQVSFSFLIPADEHYNHFELEVFTDCYGATGADILLDNFEVFVSEPKAVVDFTTPLCTDRMRHIKIHTDFDMVMGNREEGKSTVPVSYCFLDRAVYDNYLDEYLYNVIPGEMIVDEAGNPVLDDKGNIQYEKIRIIKPELTQSQIDAYYNKAFGDALIGKRALPGVEGHAFHNFDINVNYEEIEPYVFHTSVDDKIYRETINGERRIVFKEEVSTTGVSPNHNWQVGKEYYLVYSPIKVTQDEVDKHDVGTAVFKVNTRCCFLDVFTVKGAVDVKGDAEITSYDDITACKGQTVTLAVDLAGRKETGDVVIKDLIYDWWVGPSPTGVEGDDVTRLNEQGQVVYRATAANYQNQHKTVAPYQDNDGNWVTDLTLEYALTEFRKYYRTENSTKGCKPIVWHEQEHNINLTQDMIDYVTDEINAGRLILYRKTLSMPLSEENAFLVPLMTQKLDEHGVPETDADGNVILIPVLDEFGNQVMQEKIYFVVVPIRDNKYDAEEKVIYCPDPQEVSVHLTGIAPSMTDGFEGKKYPTDMQSVPLRVGLSQINDVRLSKFTAENRNVLRVPLRNISPSVTGEGGYKGVKVDPDNFKLYVVGSDDPTYAFTESDEETSNSKELTSYEVGQIVKIEANVAEGSDNYMYVVFNDDKNLGGVTIPIFREGYTYTLKVPFIDDDSNVPEDQRSTACQGFLTVDMRIVPEYQAYVGDTDDNEWTNDAHWRRVTRAELYDTQRTLPVSAIYDQNITGSTSKSFVPMNFTNVLLSSEEVNREQSVAGVTGKFYHSPKLYKLTRDDDGFINNLSSEATRYIQYELQVDKMTGGDYAYSCELFGSNVAKNVTFETGTELLGAQYLTYNKAWVEYELNFNRWYTLGSPLQGTYAGEWYAPNSSARQTTLHFSPITYNEARNDRFRPAVYQRSWDKAEANVYRLNGDALINGNNYSSPVNVVVRGDWSNVYNDVRVNYSLGGFSVKVDPNYMASKPATDAKTLIRMPKDDASYTYYDFDNDSHGQYTVHNLNRNADEHYRLYSDKLAAATEFTQTLTNTEAENNFFLISNPFMAALDMEQFFAANSDFEKKYWILTEDGQSANVRDEQSGKWIVTTAEGSFLSETAKVAPLQAFFVKKTSGNSADVKFNADMQVSRFNYDTDGIVVSGATLKSPAPVPATDSYEMFTITAERGSDVSTAVVSVNNASANAYSKNEDAETFVDSNVADKPSVYTIASGKAMSINSINGFSSLPLGVYSTENEDVTLTFNGVAALGDNVLLIDHATGDKYQVYEGMSIVVSGNTNGRYELAPGTTGIEDTVADGPVVSVAGNQVTIKAGSDPITIARAVDASGRLAYSHASEVRELTFELPQGMYLLEVITASTKQVEKIVIR